MKFRKTLILTVLWFRWWSRPKVFIPSTSSKKNGRVSNTSKSYHLCQWCVGLLFTTESATASKNDDEFLFSLWWSNFQRLLLSLYFLQYQYLDPWSSRKWINTELRCPFDLLFLSERCLFDFCPNVLPRKLKLNRTSYGIWRLTKMYTQSEIENQKDWLKVLIGNIWRTLETFRRDFQIFGLKPGVKKINEKHFFISKISSIFQTGVRVDCNVFEINLLLLW